MELIDLQSRREEDDISRLSHEIHRFSVSGHQSEPTTPPEYRDNGGFPSAFSRPNRFSISSIASPPGTGISTNRQSRSGSQITSPPSVSSTVGTQGSQSTNQLPSKSVPGSRRNSDEEAEAEDGGFDFNLTNMSPVQRGPNRLSMPVTSLDLRGRNDLPDLASVLGHINTTGFLFGDDDERPMNKNQNPAASPDVKSYLQMNTTDDKFPILVRRDGDGTMQLSASSAALDLALSQSPGPELQSSGWPSFTRHRHSQHSLPMNTLRKASQPDDYDIGQVNGKSVETPTKTMASNRHSMEINFSPFGESKRSSYNAPPPNGSSNGMPKLQSSYSANDIPTLKNGSGVNGVNGASNPSMILNSHAEQHFHNHNASLGRIPPNAINTRHSRDLSGGLKDQDNVFRPLQSVLHASAAPFGPSMTSAATSNGLTATTMTSPNLSQYSAAPAYYGGYGMSMMNMGMNNLQLGPQMGAQSGYGHTVAPMYPQSQYNPYGSAGYPGSTYGPQGRFQDSQARVIQSRRMQNGEDSNRFMNYDLKTMPRNEIYALCKDQHGCRFLQKKLEERNLEYLQIIFEETNPYVVELMTDPFGNYLCQKLLEYTNDDQRTVLVHNAAPQIVTIALNQHGTRALQKMIEFISTPEQIQTIILALSDKVVPLIQDLNGNHVIQKCLNHLKAEDAQFIFDAVGAHCVIVGTHRHGCCVLQRCIDHASGFQRAQLVQQITNNSIHLVQDPFGNYVVQYILDLNEQSFTRPLCLGFRSQVAELSKQKFSSNVIEKCIRVADMETRRVLIEELLEPIELEKLLRDSYANYVIQTALDYAPPDLCVRLIESIRPVLPSIRQTPYGRRIQSKVQERETRIGASSGHVSPHSMSATQSPQMSVAFTGQLPASSAFQAPPMYTTAANYGPNIASPQPHRLSNPPLPNHLQNSVQQSFSQFGLGAQQNGLNGFF
ncbi:ARM repeat-containing protein [Lepidopterella palustris CBS 459.81]|uniref:ARM repeat-containing protein n=1 Tax=Lepidopterella palustris CBS 459.81 TaxID=1314670 RepID=A0A8E2JCB2_9PEZI|nr:ARM repeat-containing protein [Lepidopterella palustris CBS 459.81]